MKVKIIPAKTRSVVVIRRGFGFFSALTLLLILLKLLGNDNITWGWIIAAFFGPLIVLGLVILGVIAFFIFCFLVSIGIDYYDTIQSKRRMRERQEEQLRRREKNG